MKKQKKVKVAEEKAVAVKEAPKAPVISQEESLDSWGNQAFSAKDIIIPRVMLMQPMSDSVTNGEAKFGELRESLSNSLMGDFAKALEVVPFQMRKVWVEYDVSKGSGMKDKVFLGVVPVTPQNEGQPYNEEVSGVKIMRDYVLEFFVLSVDDLKTGGAVPHILSFRRTSLKAGKQMATQMFMKNRAAGKNPAAVTIKIITKKESNDQGTYAVMDAVPGTTTPSEYVVKAFEWMQMLKASNVKTDDQAYADSGEAAQVDHGAGTKEF